MIPMIQAKSPGEAIASGKGYVAILSQCDFGSDYRLDVVQVSQ
jgi:hypothetical protein